MCGIVYAHDLEGKPVNNGIMELFDKQRERGVEGFGLFDGQQKNIVRATKEDKILDWLCKYDSNLLLFHHRWPTSTTNTKNTAHPFTTRDYFGSTEYVLVHNGHISNYQRLREQHEEQGITYRSVQNNGDFNDSESLLWDVALLLEGKQQWLKATGGMAFVCIKLVDGELDKLYFGRNSYPLNMLRVKEGIVLSSEGPGSATDSYKLYTYNYGLKRLTTKKLQIGEPYDWKQTYSDSGYDSPVYLPPPAYQRADRYADPGVHYEGDESYELPLSDEERAKAQNRALTYLVAQNGHFLAAYTELEFDYGNRAEDAWLDEEIRELRIFEEAMRILEVDPEWVNQDSISGLSFAPQRQLLAGAEA